MTHDAITLRAAQDIDSNPEWNTHGVQERIRCAIDEATAPLLETQRKFGTLQHQLMSRIEELEARLAARGDAEPVSFNPSEYCVVANHLKLYTHPAKPQSSAQLARDHGFEPCPACHGEGIATKPQGDAEPAQTTKEAWWAGYRAGKGIPPDTPRQEALAAPVSAQQVGWLNTMTRKFIGLAELAATQRNQSLIDEGVIVKCYTVPPAKPQGEGEAP